MSSAPVSARPAFIRPPSAERSWQPWSAAERENFFDAIARHRRASWRITSVCAFAIAVLTLVVAVLMSPLLICLVGLAVDVANLVVPLPDVLTDFGRYIDPLFEEKTFTATRLVHATAVASIPGFIAMGVLVLALNRALKRSPLFDAGELPGRAPTRAVLAEQRLMNIVEEMALAASIPVPNLRIVPGGINAAVFGRDESHTTVLVGEGLLASLNRAEMQGAVAHLIGSIAGGDMPIGLRAAVTFALFGLLARTGGIMGDRNAFYNVMRTLRTLVWPTRAGTERLIRELGDPFASPRSGAGATRSAQPQPTGQHNSASLTWREWALMPLMGPVILSGFMSGLVTMFLLNPLVSFAWRRRKYMADAAAVRLTRDPDTLAQTLHKMLEGGGTALQTWAAHMAIAQSAPVSHGGLLGGSIVSIFPSTERRYKALGAMGANLRATRTRPAWPFPLVAVMAVLGTVAAGLMGVVVVLLVWLSVAISGLFTVMPAAALHALLRWLGH